MIKLNLYTYFWYSLENLTYGQFLKTESTSEKMITKYKLIKIVLN